MTIPSWFVKTDYLESKLAQLKASGETAYQNIVDVDNAIQAAGMTAYDHFVAYGSQERTSPNKYFQADEYLAAKAIQMNGLIGSSGDWTADKVALAIRDAGLTIWDHFQQYGWNEGVNPSNSFDVSLYLDAKLAQLQTNEPDAGWTMDKLKDVFKEVGLSPISHYFEYGQGEFVPVQPVPADEQVPSAGGGTFTLTTGEDNLTGTSGNDTFSAPIVSDAGALVSTLQSFDVLDGGAGSDTLNATLDGAAVAARISNIEIINLRDTVSTTVDFADVTGAQQIWNSQSVAAATLTYANAPIAATFGVRNTASETDISFDDASGTADVLKLVVTGAGTAAQAAIVSSTADAGNIEGLNVTASGTNFVDLSDFNSVESLTLATTGALELEVDGAAMTDITITGSGDLDLFDSTSSFAAVENVVATDFGGNLTLDISASTTLESVATGAGNDDITVDGTLLVAGAGIEIDLGEGENTLALASIASEAELATLVFTDTDLTIAGVSTLALADALTLVAGDGTLDLDGIAPSALVFEAAVDLGGSTLALDNTAAALDITFESTVDDGTLDFGDAAETVVLTAEGVVGGTTLVELTGEALVDLTVNAEANAVFDVAATAAALEAVAINANEDTIAITSTINGDAAEETSLTSLSLTDASEAGDAVFTIDLVNTLNLTTIDLAGGVDTVFTIDAGSADFAGTVTINIGDFGVDADAATPLSATALLDYTADTTGTLREVFKFVGEDFGNVTITDFLAGVGGNADRLDFSAFDGVTALDDLNIAWDGTDTTITSDAFEGTITVAGVDLSTDAFNFIF